MNSGNLSFRNRPVVNNRFAVNPSAQVERSVFSNTWSHKTTFDAGYLIPHLVDEVIPGDSMHVQCTMFARMQTPVFPIMDDLYLDSFYFFVPSRLLWAHWPNFMGERSPNVNSSISYTIPVIDWDANVNGNNLAQYFGIPTHLYQGTPLRVNALPFRAYNLIYSEWFRDQDIINKPFISVSDGPDSAGAYIPLRRAKVPDYFTKARPWPQKGGVASSLVGSGNVSGIGWRGAVPTVGSPVFESGGETVTYGHEVATSVANTLFVQADPANNTYPLITADFSVPINQLREAEQIQVLLERDARGGTRYTEIVESHFGVKSPDARLQRPEYLGGGSQRIGVTSVPQTSESGDTPLGNLGAASAVVEQHGFSGAFVEHGYVIGLVNVRSVPTYQQGLHRMWFRSTRYDFPWPAFTHLGEQPVYSDELFMNSAIVDKTQIFGYMPRYEEYRFHKSLVTGAFRSGIPGYSIDQWHLSQEFITVPTLSETFIQENPPMARILAAGTDAENVQFLFDAVFSGRFTRPLPAFGTPQLGGRF